MKWPPSPFRHARRRRPPADGRAWLSLIIVPDDDGAAVEVSSARAGRIDRVTGRIDAATAVNLVEVLRNLAARAAVPAGAIPVPEATAGPA